MRLLLCFYCCFQTAFAQDLPSFNTQTPPPAPNYSQTASWAALPFRVDAADATPRGIAMVSDSIKEADVFFIYPTTYTKGQTWNADVNDIDLNKQVDTRPIKYQASAWNGSCRVYAPRYRQAILKAFFTDKPDGEQALDLAYSDVKRAFQYYLDNYNNGRPIVIASHSQGTRHARQLLQDFFDKSTLRNRLVCAYLVGFPVRESKYENLRACTSPTQTGGLVSWATFRKGFEPSGLKTFYKDAICINPVSWNIDTAIVSSDSSKGMTLLNFNKLQNKKVATQLHQNILWADIHNALAKKYDNLHIADINLFWLDIREDVKRRIGYFWKR